MELNICPECLYQVNGKKFCPYCGFNIAGYTAKEHHLPPGTVIGERYVIGRAIGEGGFGITYTASDIKLGGKFAVKEYYPSSISGRSSNVSDSHVICPFTGNDEEFNAGLVRFENEARRLAQFDGKAGIVNVKDYIPENGTGYIVMEYAEGISLEKYLENNGGRVNIRTASDLIKPIVLSLSEVHKSGIIHRDISPDNIIVTEKNGLVLIDFGSARQYDSEKSMSVILKFGYAPYEQYSRHGNQGPWTDVYALCAVIYRMITGKKPPDAVERLQSNDELDFSECEISEGIERALRKGLEIRAADRFQSMDELYSAFYKGVFPKEKKKGGKKTIPVIAAAAAVIICIGAAAAFGFSGSRDNDIAAETTADIEIAEMTTTVPAVTEQTTIAKFTTAEQTTTEAETTEQTTTTEAETTDQTTTESAVTKDTIRILDLNPKVKDVPLAEAEKLLSDLGINYVVKYIESFDAATGNVVSLSSNDIESIDYIEDNIVTITVNSLEVEKLYDIRYKYKEEAIELLSSRGFKYEIIENPDINLAYNQVSYYTVNGRIEDYAEKGSTITIIVNSYIDTLTATLPMPEKYDTYSAELIEGYPEICDIEYINSRYKDDFEDELAYITNSCYTTASEISFTRNFSFLKKIEEKEFSADDPEYWYYADDFDYDGKEEYYLFVIIPTDAYYVDDEGIKHTDSMNDGYDTFGAYYYVEDNGDVSFMFNFSRWIDTAYSTFGESFNKGNNDICIIDYGDCKHSLINMRIQVSCISWVTNQNKFFRHYDIYDGSNCLLISTFPDDTRKVYCIWNGSEYITYDYELVAYGGYDDTVLHEEPKLLAKTVESWHENE